MIRINIKSNTGNTPRYAKAFILINAVLLSLAGIAIIIWRGIFLNGLKLLSNMLFEASEKYQLYEYDKFEIAESASDTIFALLILSVMLAALLSFSLYRKNIFVITSVFLMFTGVQIYFGVFPPVLANIFLYTAFAAAVIYCSPARAFVSRHSCVTAIIALAVLSVIILIVRTGANPSLHSLSEFIRDQFDEKVERPVNTAMRQYNESRGDTSTQELLRRNPVSRQRNDNNAAEYGIDYDYDDSSSQAGTVRPRVLLPILLFFFIITAAPAAWIILRLRRESKRRKLFDSADYSAAIDAMFKYLMDCLISYGLKPKNDVYSKYTEQIKEFSQKEYADKYLNAVNIWQEALYSEHNMTEVQRAFMRSFMEDTMEMVNKNVGILTRFKLSLGYFGGAEE